MFCREEGRADRLVGWEALPAGDELSLVEVMLYMGDEFSVAGTVPCGIAAGSGFGTSPVVAV